MPMFHGYVIIVPDFSNLVRDYFQGGEYGVSQAPPQLLYEASPLMTVLGYNLFQLIVERISNRHRPLSLSA